MRSAARVPEGGERAKTLTALQYAADQGHLAAQWKVGRMYADGDGVPQDDMRAFNYFSQIANTTRTRAPARPRRGSSLTRSWRSAAIIFPAFPTRR